MRPGKSKVEAEARDVTEVIKNTVYMNASRSNISQYQEITPSTVCGIWGTVF